MSWKRISVPLSDEETRALEELARADRRSVASYAAKLIAESLAEKTGRPAEVGYREHGRMKIERAGRDGLSHEKEEPRRDDTTAREVSPDFKRGGR